jgi:anti-sigma factor (TIGR02949 family)
MTEQKCESCDDLLGSLSEYIDGELRAELCRDIEHHLAECEHCRVVVDTTKKTIYLVHASNDPHSSLPDDVRDRLYKSLKLDDYLKHA